MTNKEIIQAWKNPKLRSNLPDAPESPAGPIELDEAALEGVTGAKEMACITGFKICDSGGRVCTLTTECICPWWTPIITDRIPL